MKKNITSEEIIAKIKKQYNMFRNKFLKFAGYAEDDEKNGRDSHVTKSLANEYYEKKEVLIDLYAEIMDIGFIEAMHELYESTYTGEE